MDQPEEYSTWTLHIITMTQFRFFTGNLKYEDLNFYAQIEYNQGWCAARAGDRIEQSPYDEEFRGNWLMGWEEYHRYVKEPITIEFNIQDNE